MIPHLASLTPRKVVLTSPRKIHAALRWVHRWIGLTLGLIFVVVATSGSLLLFQPQFFRLAYGEMIPHDLPPEMQAIDRWVANGRAAVPKLLGPVAIWGPHVEHNVSDAGMMVFAGGTPGGFGKAGLVGVLVAPNTGAVLGVIDIDRSPVYAPVFLHHQLWAGDTGAVVTGIMAIFIALTLCIAIYLWWPGRKRLRQKLSPTPLRTTFTTAARLHDWLGIWIVAVLIVLAVSGLYLAQPEWMQPVLAMVPETVRDTNATQPTQCASAIGFDEAIARARRFAPNGTLAAVQTEDLKTWDIVFREPGSSTALRETHVKADLHCGAVALLHSPASHGARTGVQSWLTSLHDGTAFGMPGRILVTLSGIAPLVLFWSGIRMWLRRRGWIGPKRVPRRVPAESAYRV
jgi:uncharacterized iron-regulated membrane protein